MKRILALIILITVSSLTYAAPVVSNNVVILQNITSPAQCPANYRGTGYPTTPTGAQPWGPQSGTANQVVQSCSGCYFTPATRTCTCRICYGGY